MEFTPSRRQLTERFRIEIERKTKFYFHNDNSVFLSFDNFYLLFYSTICFPLNRSGIVSEAIL